MKERYNREGELECDVQYGRLVGRVLHDIEIEDEVGSDLYYLIQQLSSDRQYDGFNHKEFYGNYTR